jgi:hypothetical protein
VLSKEATNINFIVFGLTQKQFNLTIQTCLPLFVKNSKMLEKKKIRLLNAILSTETAHIANGT